MNLWRPPDRPFPPLRGYSSLLLLGTVSLERLNLERKYIHETCSISKGKLILIDSIVLIYSHLVLSFAFACLLTHLTPPTRPLGSTHFVAFCYIQQEITITIM